MKDHIAKRVLELADYIVQTKTTVRKAAKEFEISKSTVHTEGVILKLFISKWHKNLVRYILTRFFSISTEFSKIT